MKKPNSMFWLLTFGFFFYLLQSEPSAKTIGGHYAVSLIGGLIVAAIVYFCAKPLFQSEWTTYKVCGWLFIAVCAATIWQNSLSPKKHLPYANRTNASLLDNLEYKDVDSYHDSWERHDGSRRSRGR